MESFYERLIVWAATIDEILSDEFEIMPGQKGDANLAARRLAAWCISSGGGDWSLFERRLTRDGLSIGQALSSFATVRYKASAPPPAWLADAIWIDNALRRQSISIEGAMEAEGPEAVPFAHLLASLVEQSQALLWESAGTSAAEYLGHSGRACLSQTLARELSGLLAPALYERFDKKRAAAEPAGPAGQPREATAIVYDSFVAEMRAEGFRRLFEEKPVLLRLVAVLVRQWIESSREFATRLAADRAALEAGLLGSPAPGGVVQVEGGLSDPHNSGRTVQIVTFENGARLVYKPKDLRVDLAFRALVERLNGSGAPIDLKTARVMARADYGWSEYVAHDGCSEPADLARYFRRMGAWLALFHVFAGTDMHQENLIAAGDHPVPIDLEMILQATPEQGEAGEPETQAFDAAADRIANSVMMVGLLPAFAKSPDNKVLAIGGLASNWTSGKKLTWTGVNTDAMRPARADKSGPTNPNLPRLAGRYASLGDHVDDLAQGFEDYARFLKSWSEREKPDSLFDGFEKLPVRRILRPTRYYGMLLQRLRDHRVMDDAVAWSAQADFAARLVDWDRPADALWPMQRAERAALTALNVPHFVLLSDGTTLRDAARTSVEIKAVSGLERARGRLRDLDERDIAWQVEVIRLHIGRSGLAEASGGAATLPARAAGAPPPSRETLNARCDAIAATLSREAVRAGAGAAWIGIDWLGDASVSQLMPLGPALYNGATGIALFLAAHGASGHPASDELALEALAGLRKSLRSRNAPRMARALGIGGSMGLGSIVYGLTVISELRRDPGLLEDARAAAELITDERIGADAQLDAMGGAAGAILGLLRLERGAGGGDALRRAVKCGERLLATPRVGSPGSRSWPIPGSGPLPLNGMSHGAAGFALALAQLAEASGRADFAEAAAECIAFEDQSYHAERENWPDAFDDTGPLWRCRWCHGGVGIGLSRLAMPACEGVDAQVVADDIGRALASASRYWPGPSDTLCCGSLGGIELAREAARQLRRGDLAELASQRLAEVLDAAAQSGGYRWTMGRSRFNLGLFRGLAGVGYTIMRQLDASLPNVLIWE